MVPWARHFTALFLQWRGLWAAAATSGCWARPTRIGGGGGRRGCRATVWGKGLWLPACLRLQPQPQRSRPRPRPAAGWLIWGFFSSRWPRRAGHEPPRRWRGGLADQQPGQGEGQGAAVFAPWQPRHYVWAAGAGAWTRTGTGAGTRTGAGAGAGTRQNRPIVDKREEEERDDGLGD